MKKVVGKNFLHTHPRQEKELNIGRDHCIVDRRDLEEIQKFFINNPCLVELIDKKISVELSENKIRI